MIKTLIAGLALGLATYGYCSAANGPPQEIVLIVCQGHAEVESDPVASANSKFTHHEKWTWDTPVSSGGKMICKRIEQPLYDPVEGMQLKPSDEPAAPLTLNLEEWGQCNRAAAMQEPQWDEANRNTPWRVWKTGCPVPVINIGPDGRETVIGYKMPDGGHYETVTFLVDSSI